MQVQLMKAKWRFQAREVMDLSLSIIFLRTAVFNCQKWGTLRGEPSLSGKLLLTPKMAN